MFDARIASGGSTASARTKISFFTAKSSTTASISRSAGDDLVDGSTRASTSSGSAPPFSASFVEALAHRLEPALDRAGRRVVQRHAPARRRDDLGDAAAHLPCAHDEYVLERHRAAGYRRGHAARRRQRRTPLGRGARKRPGGAVRARRPRRPAPLGAAGARARARASAASATTCASGDAPSRRASSSARSTTRSACSTRSTSTAPRSSASRSAAASRSTSRSRIRIASGRSSHVAAGVSRHAGRRVQRRAGRPRTRRRRNATTSTR